MEKFKDFLKWLDGKKTIIGLIGMNIMQLDLNFIASMNPDLKTLLLWVFGALSGVGLTHKALKHKK
ncbi:hypothetical protein RPMD05_5 [Rhodobacteraceae phage LS06-2018-MD05]|nr:hypothetical protein RPMD05_5 [Rhodobacteraceae phage LS06-2018-MD05]